MIEDTPNIKELYLIIPEKSEDEDCANSPLYRLVNRYNAKGVKTILCLDNQEISADVEETLSLLAKYNNISLKSIPAGLNKNIMAVVNDGNSYYAYGSFDNEVKQLNPYWGSNVKRSEIPCRFPVIWDWSVFDLVCLIPLRFTTPPF